MNISFNYKNTETLIQCKEDEEIGEICKRYATKININIEDLMFICDGEQLNLNENIKGINKIILVYNKKETTIKDGDKMVISKDIICPECGELCLMKINNNNIRFYECKNNHEKNILLNEYEKSQIVNESKIICNICKKNNKSNTFDNTFYICIKCNINICPLCKSSHNKEHQLVNYEDRNYICREHYEYYISYCNDCKKNLCYQCDLDHDDTHKTIVYKKIMSNIKEIKNNMNEFRDKINLFNKIIDDSIKKLNELKYNIQKYYEINYNIINNFNIRNRNYQLLKNIGNMNINIINKNLNKLINEYNINNILKIDRIDFENDEEYFKENLIITLKYKINENDDKIKIFDKDFIENNKNNFKIFCEGKEYELAEYFNIKDYKNKDILEIKLLQINNEISNISKMFKECSSLLSISGLEKIDTSKVTNMSSLFEGCQLLSSLPDISNWNTSNVTSFNSLFKECISLNYLPNISKWNTNNLTNISNMFFNCNSLICLPDISKFEVSKITDFGSLFSWCSSLYCLPDISKWKTSQAKYLDYMFSGCKSLYCLPEISNWDTSNVIDMKYLFHNCLILHSLPDLSKWNTSKVKDVDYFCNECRNLKILPDISIWNTENITNMNQMFCNCLSLESLPDISKWNISKVGEKKSMFAGCKESLIIPEKFKN